jgi:hypothetical protein
VITPEGCASILWRTPDAAPQAAVAMKMTAAQQQALGVIDQVVEEPPGGAQTNHAETARRLRAAILEALAGLEGVSIPDLVEARYRRYRALGEFAVTGLGPIAPPERPGLTDRLRNLVEAGLEAGRNTLAGPGRRGRDEPGATIQPPARDEV